MRYYLLMYDYEKDVKNFQKYAGCLETNLFGKSEYEIMEGNKVGQEWVNLVLKYNPNEGHELTDFLHNIYGWLLVSEKFIKLTQEYVKDNIQYLDTVIENELTKERIYTYKLANVVNVIDAIDLENSVYNIYEVDEMKVTSVIKYAVKKEKIEGKHIFKLLDHTMPIFVSEEIKKIIKKNKLTGFDFLEIKVVE